jgi:uncharacterized membrane protein
MTIVGIALAMFPNSAYAVEKIEKMKCHGNEPFWQATLAAGKVTFKTKHPSKTSHLAPTYSPATGKPYVMSVRAKRGKSDLTAFVVNETRMDVADKNGAASSTDPNRDPIYRAYCSDQMSEKKYPFSIHLTWMDAPIQVAAGRLRTLSWGLIPILSKSDPPLAVQPVEPLRIHTPPVATQQHMDTTIAVVHPGSGDLTDTFSQMRLRGSM